MSALPQSNPVSTPVAIGATGTVLVLEDDPCIAGLLDVLLRTLASKVLVAETGGAARELLQRHGNEIGLLVMDSSPPGVSGTDWCQQLREIVPQLPILLTSGRAQPNLLQTIRDAGPADFLAKPFRPHEVVTRARALLAQRAYA